MRTLNLLAYLDIIAVVAIRILGSVLNPSVANL